MMGLVSLYYEIPESMNFSLCVSLSLFPILKGRKHFIFINNLAFFFFKQSYVYAFISPLIKVYYYL